MSALTHLSADDATWAEAMLADWSNAECGRDRSSEPGARTGAQISASLWMRGLDEEQDAANEGVCLYEFHECQVADFVSRMQCHE